MTEEEISLLNQLSALAESRDVEVRWERFGGDGATCVLGGEKVIFVDPGLPPRRKMHVLAKEVAALDDWEDVFLKPRIRELLEGG